MLSISRNLERNHIERRESVPTEFNNAFLVYPSRPFVVMLVILLSSDSIVLDCDQEQKDRKEIIIIIIIILERRADQTLPC
jgi:hypothetical protein